MRFSRCDVDEHHGENEDPTTIALTAKRDGMRRPSTGREQRTAMQNMMEKKSEILRGLPRSRRCIRRTPRAPPRRPRGAPRRVG